MRWPWTARREQRVTIETLRSRQLDLVDRLAALEADRNYWRQRCELALDTLLARAGAPSVMHEPPPAKKDWLGPLAALARQEIPRQAAAAERELEPAGAPR